MLLDLKYDPSPETAVLFARDIVDLARYVSDVALDYSERSLEAVDSILQSFTDGGVRVHDVKGTLFGFGCYVGEVFVQTAGGAWKALAADDKSLEFLGWPLVVQLPSGTVCNPIGKVFKRLELGESENLPYFYKVFANRV